MVKVLMFHHKNIRLTSAAYLGIKSYFITRCAADRRKVFHTPCTCENLLNLLHGESVLRHFSIPAYCLMPDHLHFLACGLCEESDLLSFVKSFRIKSSRAYAREASGFLWQKKFYDHILRSTVSLESVAWYIWLNPVRAGLVASAKEFPYSGSFTKAEIFGPPPNGIWKPEWKERSSW